MAKSHLKVYVASAYDDFWRTRRAMATLRAAGATITHDWTANIERYPTDDAPPLVRNQHAREDLDGVRAADVVLVLTPEDRTKGCGLWIEMGAALALNKVVVIAGAQRNRSIFGTLALRHPTDEHAVGAILEGSAWL